MLLDKTIIIIDKRREVCAYRVSDRVSQDPDYVHNTSPDQGRDLGVWTSWLNITIEICPEPKLRVQDRVFTL